jgi:S-(hydroxymethyl)glutathione dehydrogenase/alcohol dehydrogenase
MVALVRHEKTFKGSYYGSSRPSLDMHHMVDLYQSGKLDLDGLVTQHYTLDQINDAYEGLDKGVVGRGVIMFA